MGDKVLELMKEDDAAEVARRVAEQNGKSDVPGYKDGVVEGWFRGLEKARIRIVRQLVHTKLSDSKIAEVTNIRVAEVKAIRESENQKRTC